MNQFRPFGGAASRIDGKRTSSSSEQKSEAKEETKMDIGAAMEQPVAVPVRQSLIGDKYSKKKAAVSAFTGTAHKLK